MAGFMSCEAPAGEPQLTNVPTPARGGLRRPRQGGGMEVDAAEASAPGEAFAPPGQAAGMGSGSAAPLQAPPTAPAMPQQAQAQQQPNGGGAANFVLTQPQLNRLLPLLAVGFVQLQQQMAELQASSLTVAIFQKTAIVAKRGVNVGRNYSINVRRDGANHQHGSPDVHQFKMLIDTMMECDAIADKAELEIIQQSAQGGLTQLAPFVNLCRWKQMRDPHRVRLVLSINTDCQADIENGLSALDGELKRGVAPAGGSQRSVQQIIDEARG